jgi:AraC family transcriptional regulator
MELHSTSSTLTLLRERTAAGLILQDVIYSPGYAAPTHEHELPYFSLFVQGGCTEFHVRDREERGALSLILHPPGNVHSFRVYEVGLRCLNVKLDPAWLARFSQVIDLPDLTREFTGGSITWLGTRLYREFWTDDAVSSLTIEALATEVLADAARRATPKAERRPPRWLRQAKELLHDQFAEPLSLDDVAAAVGVHPVHLARSFRQRYGSSVGEYLRRLRIDSACAALAGSDRPIGAIALDAGFSDQSHFSKAFRRLTGLSPAEYRKAHRRR